MDNTVVVDVWGPFACFTPPYSKVERISYEVPTPSACRGVLSAIYNKPVEFYYQITKIEVMNPIRMMNIKKNEVNQKTKDNFYSSSYEMEKFNDEIEKIEKMILESTQKEELRKLEKERNKKLKDKKKCYKTALSKISSTDYTINTSDSDVRTQRNTYYLRDVYYRIHAKMIKRPGCEPRVTETGLVEQFNQKIKNGKCFYQPFLGMRECMCFFQEPDPEKKPIQESKELGIMLYDNFDLRSIDPVIVNESKVTSGKPLKTFYYPVMKNGIISVPDFEDVLKASI